MSFATGYRGVRNGSVQSTYQDQPGVAYNGMLAFASDINNCDAIFIGETGGIRAGAGVRFLASLEPSVAPIQRPPFQAFLPEGDEAANEFAGIVVFDEAMQSDENGVPGWNNGRPARILRPGRSGGRIYILVKDDIVVGTSTVNWVTSPDALGKYERGDFCPTALAGGAAGTSVALTNCVWELGAEAGGLAMMSLQGNVIPIMSTDDSSL